MLNFLECSKGTGGGGGGGGGWQNPNFEIDLQPKALLQNNYLASMECSTIRSEW